MQAEEVEFCLSVFGFEHVKQWLVTLEVSIVGLHGELLEAYVLKDGEGSICNLTFDICNLLKVLRSNAYIILYQML